LSQRLNAAAYRQGSTSTRRTARRTCSAASRLLVGPSLDLGTQPELDTALAEVENRLRHVAVPLLILEHRVAVGQAENLRNSLRVY
jgi:hypothetical protein